MPEQTKIDIDRQAQLAAVLTGPRAATPIAPSDSIDGETLILIRGPLAFAFTATPELHADTPTVNLIGYTATTVLPSDIVARPPRRFGRMVKPEAAFKHLLRRRTRRPEASDLQQWVIGHIGSNARLGRVFWHSHWPVPAVALEPGVKLDGRFAMGLRVEAVADVKGSR